MSSCFFCAKRIYFIFFATLFFFAQLCFQFPRIYFCSTISDSSLLFHVAISSDCVFILSLFGAFHSFSRGKLFIATTKLITIGPNRNVSHFHLRALFVTRIFRCTRLFPFSKNFIFKNFLLLFKIVMDIRMYTVSMHQKETASDKKLILMCIIFNELKSL